jgi:hypothetical protein
MIGIFADGMRLSILTVKTYHDLDERIENCSDTWLELCEITLAILATILRTLGEQPERNLSEICTDKNDQVDRLQTFSVMVFCIDQSWYNG